MLLVNLAATIYGTIQLKVDFDPAWYLHQHGTVLKIREYTEKYFPKTNEFKSKYSLKHNVIFHITILCLLTKV